MTNQLLLYADAVPLNADAHRHVSVRQSRDYGFARGLGAVPLVTAEFAAAAPEMPIVFAKTEDGYFPWAMTGLDNNSNIFVDEAGNWTGSYIPAFLRRYPFVFATSPENEQLVLCIDESHDTLNRTGVGERLFDSEGNRTQYLNSMLSFSTEYQRQFIRSKAFCARLDSLDLFEPVAASFTDSSGQARRIAGFSRIKRSALKAIGQEALLEMFANDELELCYLHLQSLANVAKVTPKTVAEQASETVTAQDDIAEQTEPVAQANPEDPDASAYPLDQDPQEAATISEQASDPASFDHEPEATPQPAHPLEASDWEAPAATQEALAEPA